MLDAPQIGAYAYLLGLYLGDGNLQAGGSRQLKITLDARYPGVIVATTEAMDLLSPNKVSVRKDPRAECFQVYSAWAAWPALLPQHGHGRKHGRPIVLEPWQRAIVDAYPKQFVRGLIHSDGCRTLNRFKTTLPSGRIGEYAYVRYFFSNLSPDIRQLFCDACELLGIRWTQSNHRNISISHRDSVAILESFVGPKT